MRKSFRSIAIVSAFLALSAFGWAKPGKGNGGNQNTTFTVGLVTCTDSRILDVSGSYTIATDRGDTLTLDMTQDTRGKLVTSGTISLAENEGNSVSFTLTGKLQLTAQSKLSLSLNGKEPLSGTSIKVTGEFDGTAFNLTVQSTDASETTSFGFVLVPQNPARGFTISDAPSTPQGKSNLTSMRTVTLPWGTQQLSAKQQNKGSQVTFTMKSSTFGIDLRGSDKGVTRNSVKLGYGNVDVPASETSVTPSTFVNN